ncbi:hypothetical protein SNE40_013376 [Patella caerulea]|uniref:Vitellogenin domain-containing protein n=1 Tax=Patella caerulea TaxID=87958 RepID=A0AAN8JFX3_PATCE
MTTPMLGAWGTLYVTVLLGFLGSIRGNFINFHPGYEYEYKLDSTSSVKNIGEFHLKAKVGYINVREQGDLQEILIRVHTFTFTQSSSPHTAGHDVNFSRWFSFLINRHGEILEVFYPSDEDDEMVVVKKGMAAMFAARLHHEDETTMEKTEDGWQYHVQELGHEGRHNSTYKVKPHAEGKVFTKIRHDHPLEHAISKYTKTLYFNTDLGTIHTVDVDEHFSAMRQTVPGYNAFEGQRPSQAVNEFTETEYPEMAAFGKGKLEFISKHQLSSTPDRSKIDVTSDSIHIHKVKQHPTRSETPKVILEQIKGNLTIMRNQPEKKATQEMTNGFHRLITCLELLDDEHFENLTNHYLNLNPLSTRNEKDRNHILDAVAGTGTDRAQNVLTEKVLNTEQPDKQLIMRLMVHIISMDEVPNKKLLSKLFQLGFEPEKSLEILQEGEVYHRILLTIGSVVRKLNQEGRHEEAREAISKVENMLGYHDPYNFRVRRSVLTEEQIERDDIWRVNLLSTLGNARMEQSYEYIVSHINSTNCQWIKRAGVHALRGYHHDHAANLMLKTAMYDEHDTVRYEALLQYQAHPRAKHITPYRASNSSFTGNDSSMYFNPWDLNSQDVAVHSRHRRGFLDKGFEFVLKSPSIDWKKMLGSTKIGASFGILVKNLLDLKISALSGNAIVDVHDEAYARVHLGVVGINLDFFLARVCFKGKAEYNINLLQEFGIDNLKQLVELYDKIKNDVVKEIKKGIDLFKSIIRGDISIGKIIDEFKAALEELPLKVLNLGKKAIATMTKLGEIDEKDLPPFIRPLRNLVTKVVTLYNDIRKDVMGFYNQLLETVTIIVPRAGKQIYTSIKAIIEAFKDFNNDPKKAIAGVGGNVLNIGMEVKNLIDAVNKTKDACFFLKKEKPYWFDLKGEFAEIKNLTSQTKAALVKGGQTWIGETFKKGQDPVAAFTNGRFSTADLRKQVMDDLKAIIDDLLEPFDSIKALGESFFNRFTSIFKLVTDIKDAYNTLKEGYSTARSLIDRVFGPKCHRDFPKKFRTKGGGCDGSGFYPSELKKGKEYDVDGVDLQISRDSKIVAPFPGYIMLSPTNDNEVIIQATGGSLKDTKLIITNIKPNSTITRQDSPDYTQKLVTAGQKIGEVTPSVCDAEDHIHFAMQKNNGGVIDPTRYVPPRIPALPKWEQECDDYKLVWKFDVISEGVLIGLGGRDNKTEEPARTGGNIEKPINLDDQDDPAKVLDDGLFGDDSMLGKVEKNSDKVDQKTKNTKDSGLKNFFKKPTAFLQKFSIRKLKVGAILDLLDILGLDESKGHMAEVILKIKEIIDNKPCFNPYQMTDDQLRTELTERGKIAEGSRQTMINTLTNHGSKCPGMSLRLPKNMYCTFDQHCLGLECCVHLKVFMFLKTYKLYARFDPCNLEFVLGIKDKFEKKFGGFGDIYGGFDLEVKPGVKIDVLGGMELIIRVKVEKTDTVALGTVGVGFCSQEDNTNCMPFMMLLDESILPLPICNADGSLTWPEVNWKEYYSRDAIKKRLKESAKKLAEESVEYGLKEALKQLGIPEDLLEETPPCQRPEILTNAILKERLGDRGLITTGTTQQLIDRLIQAEKTCKIFDKTLTLPAIKNEKLKKLIYLQIADNCMHLQACVDVKIRTKLFNFTKAFNAYVELDSCNFMLHVGFEKYKHSIVLIGYQWGTPEEIPIGDAITLRFTIDKNSDEKVFIVDFGLKIKLTDDETSIDSQMIEDMRIPIPICNENFTLPGGGSIKEFAKAMGGKLSQAAVDVIFQKLGLNKIFTDGTCSVAPSPKDCPWNIDVEKYLPATLKDKVTCGMPENCFGLHCCVDFEFKIPFVDEPIQKSVPVFLEFDPCNFVLKVGFGQFQHTETLLTYDWGKPSTLTIGNGDPAPITISFTIAQYPKGFIVDLTVKACIPIDGTPFCFPEEGIQLMNQERIPACDARSLANLTNIDFNLNDFMKEVGAEAGQKLAASAARFLLDKFGITPYLLEERCDIKRPPYSSNTDGWRNDCPKPIKKLPKLPKGLVCHLGDTCTKIDCCFNVDFLDMSFHAFLNIDTCDYFIEAAIENKDVRYSLLGDDIDLNTGVTGDVKISDFFNVEYGVRKVDKKFILDLTVKVCFDKDECQVELPVLVGTEIPQLICDLNAKLDFNLKNFSVSEWVKTKGLDLAKDLTKQAVRVLLEQLGIADKLLNPPCSRTSLKYQPADTNNWKNDCPKVKNLPAINAPVNCYIPDYCTGVDCCLYNDILDMSINAYLYIDTCNYVIEGAIEKFGFKFPILEYAWGEEKEEKLSEMMFISFKIDRLVNEKIFIVDLTIKMCLKGPDSCEVELPVFTQNRLPMPLCNMQMGFKIKDFSLKNWLQERGGELTAILANQLMDQLGITEFLKDEPCSFVKEPFKTATANNGWKKDCPLNMTLPALPSNLGCYIPDYCTGIICCTEVSQVRRAFQAHILIDGCNFQMSVGIEKIFFNISLVDYEWGKDEIIDIGGLFKLTFSIDDLQGEKQFIVNMRLSACLTAGETCQLEIPVFTDMRVPKVLCDWDATLALKDFKLDEWLQEQAANIGDSLTDTLVEQLLDRLGVAPYLQDPMCDTAVAPYAPNQNGWNIECPLALNLPTLPSKIFCNVPDYCTGINCCLEVPFLRRSFNALASINMCTYVLTIGIEDVKFKTSLVNYEWGKPAHFNLRGVVRIDYTIDNLDGEKQFLLSMNMSVCLSSDKPCQSTFNLMNNARIPKLFCDWNATIALKGFNLTKFLEEQYANIGDKLSDLTLSKLFEALGISRYLLKPQCDRSSGVYSPANVNGWKYDCPVTTLNFGKLPDYVTCRIPDFCTGIDCCVSVPVIGHSFNVKVYLNACDYTLTVSIENLVYKKTLLNYQWGTREQFNINGVVGIEFVIDNLDGAKQYMLSLSSTFCFDSNSPCLVIPVLENAKVPKILCDWESDYSIKDFSLETWLAEKGQQIGDQLSSIVLSKLYEELGIAAYLNDPQCDRNTGVYSGAVAGWKNACPAINDLPSLPSDLSCYIPDTCGGIQCCVDVAPLRRSFEALVFLNPCDFTFRVGIEKYQFNRNLINYQWGTLEHFTLKKLVRVEFVIDDLSSEKKFLVNLNISVCLEANKPCLISIPVLTNARIPKLICDWDSTLALQDFSITNWLEEQKEAGLQKLTSTLTAKLYEELGIAGYLRTTQCDRTKDQFASADVKGWTNECPSSKVVPYLPDLPDALTCHMGSRCTSIDCCVDVGFLDRSFYFGVDVNLCDYTITATIENLSYKRKLFNYKWGEVDHFYLKGVVRVDFILSRLPGEKAIEMSVNISVCVDKDKCLYDKTVIDKKQIPQPLCNFQQSLLDNSFSLKDWKQKAKLPSISSLTDVLIDKLLEQVDLSGYLTEPGCNRDASPYVPANGKNWKKDCPSTINLPTLPDTTRCHWSTDCSTIDCCLYVGIVKRSVNLRLNIDICNLQMTFTVEKMTYTISLFDYNWGSSGIFHLKGRLRLEYKLENKPTENKIIADLSIKVCFEDSTCILDVPVLQQASISYSPCDITKPVPFKGVSFDFWSLKSCTLTAPPSGCSIGLPAPISNICHLNDNCLGISCCMTLDLKYLGSYSLAASFNLDHCANKLTYTLENKKWEKTLLSLPLDTNITEAVGEAIDISYIVSDINSAYVVTLHIRLCALNTYQNIPYCKYWTLLDRKPFDKPGCTSGRKRRSVIKEISQNDYEVGIKTLLGRNATNEEIAAFMNEVETNEATEVEKNLFPDWEDGGQANNIRSALKTMGSSNPSTILYTSNNGKVSVGVEGSEEMFKILGVASNIIDNAEQAFVVGKGLTGAGVQLLGAKLSNMTIGEIMAMIDTKNIDPEKALELVKQLRNLGLALYSEIIDAVLTGEATDAFKSLDFTLQGDFSFPRSEVILFKYSIYFLLGGLVPMNFRFGAGCTYGMQIIVGGKMMKMVAFGGATPYGAVLTYGELNIGFILYAGLRLEGYIMTTSFPTRAEIGFSKFPLDIGMTMDLELVPLRLRLLGIVTLRIKLLFVTIKKTLFKATLWEYSTPVIRKRLIDFGKKEKDASPPAFSEYTDSKSGRKKRAVGETINTATRQCSVRQLPDRDYTEPAIELSVRSEDDKSQVRLFLQGGTRPGLQDAFPETELGGPSSVITTRLSHSGIPIYFTVVGKNSGGGSATVTCSIPTYDTSLPGGRFTADFVTSSNPRVLKASVVVFEDSDLEYSAIGVGVGRGIYSDEMENWTPVNLKNRNNQNYDASSDPNGFEAKKHFTASKQARLIAPVAREFRKINTVADCMQRCLALPETKCLSINFDFGTSGHCELLEAIEGHDHKIAISGDYVHMERLGVGLAYEFSYADKTLLHDKLYYFNLDLKNVLGYRHIISTKSVLIDLTPPQPGLIVNGSRDNLEKVDCLQGIPSDRPEWKDKCIDQSTTVLNHRTIVDGEGSMTVFNGHSPLLDQRYFRANRFISANWDGIHDKETGLLGYSFTAGKTVCEESIHPHHDPHKHLFDESEWTHIGIIKRDESNPLADGKYYVTVRALNKVEYGGPLVTTFCHTTPYVIDNTKPFVYEVFDVQYDEESEDLSTAYNATDPESDIKEIDLCLGETTKDCGISDWTRYEHSEQVIHNTVLPGGTPVWVKIRAWNNVNMSAIKSADHPLILDNTPPIAGEVYDGPLFKHDLVYTKDSNKICANWVDFFDPESGISYFSVFVRSSENDMYLTNGTDFDHRTHKACIDLVDNALQHGKNYYIELWAFNAGHKQMNTSGRSNGVTVDLTVPVAGEIIDGLKNNFVDIEFSAATATIASQWRGHSDPESNIRSYEVQILRARNKTNNFEILRDWHEMDNSTESVEWHNFHLHHRDSIKTKLRTTNGALGQIVEETDGYIVDLTPPRLIYLNDGGTQQTDIDYQSTLTSIKANFKFVDEESGIDHYKYQIYKLQQGSKHQIIPATIGEWTDIKDGTAQSVTIDNQALVNGARYITRIGAVNRANAVATYDSDGFLLDNTPPKMQWVHVGIFNGEDEEVIDGHVLQADTKGIKATWFATDDVSGIMTYLVSVGTTSGGQDILSWRNMKSDRDGYIDDITLQVKTDNSPYYYVTVKAINGAGLESGVLTSTPIKVVEEDKAGIVIDGADGTEKSGSTGVDVDYQKDTGAVTVQFSGFESALHGISKFDWAVGTTAGGEDIQPFLTAGLIHEEALDIPGNGIASSGYGQAVLPLESGKMYFTTVRGITNVGNVLESISDGFIVDTSPPTITINSLFEVTGQQNVSAGNKIYQSEVDSMSVNFKMVDNESGLEKMYYAVGTYPDGADTRPVTQLTTFLNGEGSLPVGEVRPATNGKPNIVTFWSENKVGIIGKTTSATLIVDTTPPVEGVVTCPTYIQPHSSMKCTWDGFVDAESPIVEFSFGLGSQEGLKDIIQPKSLPGHSTSYLVQDLSDTVSHGNTYFAIVTATNAVGKSISAISNGTSVDVTPPLHGTVVELNTAYVINVTSDRSTAVLNAYTCNTVEDCGKIDAVCQESLSTVNIAWSAFTDPETKIVKYEVAIGSTPGGGQIKPFFTVPVEKRYLTVKNLMLRGMKQVFVTIKATNGAGLSTISTSNGIYLSYVSQGLPALSYIGVWDGDAPTGDIDFQTNLNTIRSRWDVSGDPCPVSKYEWAIERIDGLRVQDYTDTKGQTVGVNDQLDLKNGERYYILLRVTNAGGFTYYLRSNGVTIEEEPLIPGQVYDGEVVGYDLNFVYTKNKVSANWQGFGETQGSDDIQVDSGNLGVVVKKSRAYQDIEYYEVAVGKDRRFPKTRDNVVPFTKVGLNKTVTFYDLDLVPLSATYYFTVRAYSKSFSMAEVTSNGFQVGYDDGVQAGDIDMPDFVKDNTVLDIQWDGFTSKVGILMYYLALSTNNNASDMECRQFIEGESMAVDDRVKLFDIKDIDNVGKDTFIQLTNLTLQQNNGYYVTVIGVDKAGECNMTTQYFHVDVTEPSRGQIKVGPYYDMKMSYVYTPESVLAEWKDFSDLESGIKCYRVSLIEEASCEQGASRVVIVPDIEIDENSTSYKFMGLELKPSRPYIVRITVENKAGLIITEETNPVLYDVSDPIPGRVVDGTNFRKDVVWAKSTSTVKGTILQLPTPDGLPCPTRNMLFSDPLWKRYDSKMNYDTTGTRLDLIYRSANVFTDKGRAGELEIKLAKDVKSQTMFSGGYYRNADLINGGEYQFEVQAADGDGNAVTSILFWDGPETSITDYDYTKEPDWTQEICSCCRTNQNDPACLKTCNCKEFLEAKNIVKRSTTNNTDDSAGIVVQDLTEEERAALMSASSTEAAEADTPAVKLESYNSCGIQILSGEAQKVITWCKFRDDFNRPMKSERKLTFDPSKSFNNYKIQFVVLNEEETEGTWCVNVFVNKETISELCGIPQFSLDTKLYLHVWNWKNFIPPPPPNPLDAFDIWTARAIVKGLVMPPERNALCRYGDPYRGGTNAIVEYEAGIGRVTHGSSVVPFKKVVTPCVPCRVPCDRYSCQSSCKSDEFTLHEITLDSLDLKPTEVMNSTIKPILYYLSVKAVLGSGRDAISSSNGFYIDISPPVFDKDAMLYIDVSQGNFTPVEYQGSNTTIKSIWLCQDNESLVVEYQWGIGSAPGLLDIQDFVSTGINPTGTNDQLEQVLEDNSTYYVTVKCINGAGHETVHKDMTGVTVLLFPPDITDVGTNITGAEPFDEPVTPPTAMKSTDTSSIGCTWTVSKDPSIKEYDFCVGSSEDVCDDIFPCTWVGYNVSGEVAIKDGYLQVDGVKVGPIGTFKSQYNGTDPDNASSTFKMEPGRTMFLCMKMCNEARRCTTRVMGSSVIVDSNSKMATSTNGESVSVSLGSSTTGRKKRAVSGVSVTTPSGLKPGQSILETELTKEQLEADYRSDASVDFVSFITNPQITLINNDNLHRLLIKRITPKATDKHFTITSVGNLRMPGPMTVKLTYNPATIDADKIPSLLHWNPVEQKWILSKTSCINEENTEVINEANGEISIKVCDTRRTESTSTTTIARRRRATTNDVYFGQDTQFLVTDILRTIPNSPPELTSTTIVTMDEDAGTLTYRLTVTDDEGDKVEFILDRSSTTNLGSVNLTSLGQLVYLPCKDCSGQLDVPIIIREIQTGDIPPKETRETITITVTPVNDPPTVFTFNNGNNILGLDPTEPVIVLMEQNRNGQDDANSYTWTFGVYDVDKNEQLRLFLDRPINGSLTIGSEIKTTPSCGQGSEDNMLPCSAMSLPHSPGDMTWSYYTMTYQPKNGVIGYDDIRLFINDRQGSSSDVVTLRMAMMEQPCLNGGMCRSDNVNATYTCQDSRRAENFHDYYSCECSAGWIGEICNEDFDECQSSPCLWPYVCYNQENRYQCACPVDEPNCDALVGWMIALIVIAVVMVIIISLLLFYICIVRKRRVKWSNLFDRYGSDTASDEAMSFNNKAYKLDPDDDDLETEQEVSGGSTMIMFNKRHQYDALSGPMKGVQAVDVPAFQSPTPRGSIGPYSFPIKHKSPRHTPRNSPQVSDGRRDSGHARVVFPPVEARRARNGNNSEPRPDYD